MIDILWKLNVFHLQHACVFLFRFMIYTLLLFCTAVSVMRAYSIVFALITRKTSLKLLILQNYMHFDIYEHYDKTIHGIFNDYTFSFQAIVHNSYYYNINRIPAFNGNIMDNGLGQITAIISCIILLLCLMENV